MRSKLAGVAVFIAVTVVACSGAPATSDPSASGRSNPPPILGASPTALPASPDPSTSTASALPEPSLEPPPAAAATIAGRRYPGVIGGYSWKAYSEAAPWLPARALDVIRVEPREHVTVTLRGARIAHWTATIARASDTTGSHPTGLGEGTGPIRLATPRRGSWVLSVSIEYAGSLGSGSYYWSLSVK